MAKVEACRTYGSELIMGGESFEDALAAAKADIEETGQPSSTRSKTPSSSPARGRSASSSPSRCRRPRRS